MYIFLFRLFQFTFLYKVSIKLCKVSKSLSLSSEAIRFNSNSKIISSSEPCQEYLEHGFGAQLATQHIDASVIVRKPMSDVCDYFEKDRPTYCEGFVHAVLKNNGQMCAVGYGQLVSCCLWLCTVFGISFILLMSRRLLQMLLCRETLVNW